MADDSAKRIDDYAKWIIANKDKKGTPEFRVVVGAWEREKAKQATQPPTGQPPTEQPPAAQQQTPAASRGVRTPSIDLPGAVEKLQGLGRGLLSPLIAIDNMKPEERQRVFDMLRLGKEGDAPVSEFIGSFGGAPAAAGGAKLGGAVIESARTGTMPRALLSRVLGKEAAPAAASASEASRAKWTALAEASPKVTQETIDAAKMAHDHGYSLSPRFIAGDTARGQLRKAGESAVGSPAVSAANSAKNVTRNDVLAKVEIKMHPDEEFSTGIPRVKKEVGKVYTDVRRLGRLPQDEQYTADIKKVGQDLVEYTEDFGKGTRPGYDKVAALKAKHLIDERVDPLSESYLKEIRNLRQDAATNLKVHDPELNPLGKAQREIADAMEARIGRYADRLAVGDPQATAWALQNGALGARAGKVGTFARDVRDLAARFKTARQDFAKIYAVEDSLGAGDHVDAHAMKVRQDVKGDLTGNLAKIARIAKNFGDDVRPIGEKGEKSTWSRMDFLMGGTGLLSGHVAFTGPALIKPIIAGKLASEGTQKAMIRSLGKKPGVISRTLTSTPVKGMAKGAVRQSTLGTVGAVRDLAATAMGQEDAPQ